MNDMINRHFSSLKYTREATEEEYGTMIRRSARILGMEKWLLYFREVCRLNIVGLVSKSANTIRTVVNQLKTI